jgi:DdrB-like protein
MNNDEFSMLMTVLLRIADALDRMAPPVKSAPNYQYPLHTFRNFDWSSISAIVEQSDEYGAGVVKWGEQLWTRRCPTNRYGAAIWFSRAVGKNEDGSTLYERLITFKPRNTEVEPISQKTANLINGKGT